MRTDRIAIADLGDDFAPRRRPEVTSVELDGEGVLYYGETIHRLDALATVLWNCFDGTVTIGELVEDLGTVYPDEPSTNIRAGIYECVRTLGRDDLLANVRPDPGD
ncbi:MAG TPA: PqqD family peptide modification chaperone [Acidimicrobiia bacterium]|nr:PqqD family peptide modification chaperone [Acidimicrobiia bacterium]